MAAQAQGRDQDRERLLVLGAGTMGAQIALQSALHGIEVSLVDISAEQLGKGRAQMEELLERRVSKGRMSSEDAAAALARIEASDDLASHGPRCAWAIEAVVERLDVKKEVFRSLARVLPPAAGIATNSSHIRAAELTEDEEFRGRCLNMHFFHPVLVMDLVEVVASPYSEPGLVERAVAWSERMGRTPVVLAKDVDGFLVNRILGEASREAFGLLADGVAGFADIDVAVRRGLRWPLGPFQLADLSGLDVLYQSRRNRYERHGHEADLRTIEVLAGLVEAGRLGRKTGVGFYDYSEDPARPVPLPGKGIRTSRSG